MAIQSQRSKAYYQREFVENGRSPADIAEEWGTYPNKIRRELKDLGFALRNKSEAQSAALKSGRHGHPTKGRARPEEVRQKISESLTGRDDLGRRRQDGREQWAAMSKEERSAFINKARDAIRLTAKHGSKVERFLMVFLKGKGLAPTFRPDDRYLGDILLERQKVIIDVRGPSHYMPIWGEERLKNVQLADTALELAAYKNGYRVLVVKYMSQSFGLAQQARLARRVMTALSESSIGEIEV